LTATKGTKKVNRAKAWTAEEDELFRKLIISNATTVEIATQLGRTPSSVRTRAGILRISLGRSRFRIKANGK
jgi:hypothetical protein